MGSQPTCNRCGCAIVSSIIGKRGERMAACGCSKIIGLTNQDVPEYWGVQLTERGLVG